MGWKEWKEKYDKLNERVARGFGKRYYNYFMRQRGKKEEKKKKVAVQGVEELLNLYGRKRLIGNISIRIIREQGKVAVEEEIRSATSGMKTGVVGALIFFGISFYVFYAYWTYLPMIMLWPLSYYLVLGFSVFLGVLCWVGASLSYDRRKRMYRLIEAFERAEIKEK